MLDKDQAAKQYRSFDGYPNRERIKFHTWLVGTDSSRKKAMNTHRQYAKENKANRAFHLREALRLRAILRSGVVYYFHVDDNSGKTYPLIPFVPADSSLQYTKADAR